MPLITCPDRRSLQHFLLGKIPEKFSGSLEEHLGECSACAEVAQTLSVGDDLTAAIERGIEQQRRQTRGDELGRLGDYRVLKVLGVGGMGMVFKAEDTRLGRLKALKVMLPSVAVKPQAKERFLREVRATAALSHDHIVQIYQVGEDHGVPFIAMQYLEGQSLQGAFTRLKRLPGQGVARIGKEVALGLAAAPEKGLIHRDIKP